MELIAGFFLESFSRSPAGIATMKKSNSLGARSSISSSSERAVDSIAMITSETDHKVLFYVINYKPSGFAFVSATTRSKNAILAFSSDGRFNLQEARNEAGIRDWLKATSKHLDSLIHSDTASEHWKVQNAAGATASAIAAYKAPLLQSAWDQGVGYNNFVVPPYMGSWNCTAYANGKPPVGCVAVAMGQVMFYWQHPKMATYRWAQVAAENATGNGGSVTSWNLNTWAEALEMKFACEGSGTQTSKIVTFLTNPYQKYNASMAYINYNTETVLANLDNNRPVIIDGFKSDLSVGHAWVCDGYQKMDDNTVYLHQNWGWGKFSPNYFFLAGDFTPYPGTSYNTNCRMVVNIFPK